MPIMPRYPAGLPCTEIGPVLIDPAIALAPMAGFTGHPFRILAREFGCGLLFTEMIHAGALLHGGKGVFFLTHFTDAERPIGLQLFGSEPALLARAARKAEKLGADLIDLNLGCPTPRIVRNGDGGALLRQPRLCSEIFETVVRAVTCPVTAKVRAGWDERRINAVEIATRAEDAGIKAITVHGRTVAQGFAGRADWEIIGRVKEAVAIPVFGNGDIASAEDAAAVLARSRCDGIAIGRAALGNPWIFKQVRARLEGKKPEPPPTLPERLAVFRRHLELSCDFRGEKEALAEMRRQAGRYLRGFPGAAQLRNSLIEATSLNRLEAVIRRLLNCDNIE